MIKKWKARKQVAKLSQSDRATGWVSFGRHYRSVFNHCDVIQGHRCRYQSKPVCDFLLVIKTNWHPILYRFEDIIIADYCSNFGRKRSLRFRAPFGGLGAKYTVYLKFILKLVVDFLVFNQRISMENPRFRRNGVSLAQSFRHKGLFTTNHFFSAGKLDECAFYTV